ncbi:MAG: transglutaminase, partial [Bacteroidia bacterium]
MDAALEVNHWCHEKAVYRPSDIRTRSPLATVKTAFGRCGEESTFTVAALRAVGIPARQVYTPRWAHTDDNHAWVETWVDGKWYFLGACEPEPVLNMAWFNAPVARGMLMRAKVFGKYNGPEDIMKETTGYTEVNVTDNYTTTANVTILVVDKNDKPVEGALVEFKIYNYAEFFSVAKKVTEKEGTATLSGGKGDMLVWASKDGEFGFKKVTFGKKDTYKITLEDEAVVRGKIFDFDIIPPKKGLIPIDVTKEQKEENAKRLAEEDRIRQAYESTFYTAEKAADLAKRLSLDKDALTHIMLESRGNWKEIRQFLRDTPIKNRERAMALLNVISTKDLKDTEVPVLQDHLKYSINTKSELFTEYILNPRVANELLTPYKAFFQKNISKQEQQAYQNNPQKLFNWVKDNIKINPKMNPQRVAIMPKGVWKSRVA